MNIQQILDEQNIKYQIGGSHKNVRYGWIGIDCPWCGGISGKAYLGINLANNHTICWKCGPHRLGDTLMKLTQHPWSVVKNWLSKLEHPTKINFITSVTNPDEVIIPKGVLPFQWVHRNYLDSRGFNAEEITKVWGVEGIGLGGLELAWRLWIPITVNGIIVSWSTRAIGRASSKYVSARPEQEVIPHKNVLYGADKAHHTIIVCEGPIDVWAIGPGAVALFGLGWSKSQLLEITAYPRRVICFDSERGAQRRGDRLCSALKMFPGETCRVELESGGDPAEASGEELQKLREKFLETQLQEN